MHVFRLAQLDIVCAPAADQSRAALAHLNGVRKFFIFMCAALLVGYLAAARPAWLPGWARSAANAVALPFRLAALGAKEADAELRVPVEGVRAARVKDSWHAPRSGGRLHEGQDIFARRGTPVYSATEGYVVRVGESALGGLTVFVAGRAGAGTITRTSTRTRPICRSATT